MTGVSVLMVSLRKSHVLHYTAIEERRLRREKRWGRSSPPPAGDLNSRRLRLPPAALRHPAGHSRDVAREPSNRTGFLMRFPIPLLVGTSFEGLAGVLHLLVELTKHHLSNGHDFLPCGIRDSGAPILGEQKANCQVLLAFTATPPAPPLFGPFLLRLANTARGPSGFAAPQ